MLCEKCGEQPATKSIRIEPKANPQLRVIINACDPCITLLKARYDNRSDRQVFVEPIGSAPKHSHTPGLV